MNKFNMIRKLLLFLALCLYAVILSELSSSEVFASELKSEKATAKMTPEAYLEQYLEAFNNLDADAAFNLWLHEGDIKEAQESSLASFQEYLEIWGDKKSYTYTKLGEKERPSRKEYLGGTEYLYLVKTEEGLFQADLVLIDNYNGQSGLSYFKFTRKEEPIGTYNTWKQFDFWQWFMAFCAIIEVVFTLYTSRICIKRKQKLWGLWLLLILIVYGGVCFTVTENVQVGFFVYTLFMPKIMKYSTGVQVFLSLPVGAIVYWILNHNKRKEIKKDIN